MEALSRALEEGAASAWSVHAALREVDRLGKNVRELVDLATPPTPNPLRCTLGEIVGGVRYQLAPEQRSRVICAHSPRGATIRIDGPLITRCLKRLIENALEAAADQILIVASREEGSTRFSVIDDGPQPIDSEWSLTPFRSTKRNHLGLGLTLSERDSELLRGSLEVRSTNGGETRVTVTIPDQVRPSIQATPTNNGGESG